jgi:hypothetical protein
MQNIIVYDFWLPIHIVKDKYMISEKILYFSIINYTWKETNCLNESHDVLYPWQLLQSINILNLKGEYVGSIEYLKQL